MKRIILDTNFLLIPYQFKVDIFSEIKRVCASSHRLFVLDRTVDELKRLVIKEKGRDKLAAMLALVFIKEKGVSVIATKGSKDVDDLLVGEAGKDAIVATQDAGLKQRLRKKGVQLIVMKGKSHLCLI